MSVADDGRGMTAISLGELSSEPNRGYPNWATYLGKPQILFGEGTGGTETSKYPEEKKSNEIPIVVANELGTAQTWRA